MVLASVPGTPQAQEAVIANSIPQTATVTRAAATFTATYDGAPQWRPIAGTPLAYAANAPTPIIRVDAKTYYALYNGVWFVTAAPAGPWVVAATVPAVVYTIPVTSPLHYVTYVRVYGATPTVVYVGYTPGYLGTVVAPDGVVVYGTGVVYTPWVGTVWYPPPPTYGAGAGFAWGATTGFIMGAATGAAMWGCCAELDDVQHERQREQDHLQLQRLERVQQLEQDHRVERRQERDGVSGPQYQGRDEQPEQQRLCVPRRQRLQEAGRIVGEVGRRRQRLAAREHQHDELERSEPGRPEAGDPAVHGATAEPPSREASRRAPGNRMRNSKPPSGRAARAVSRRRVSKRSDRAGRVARSRARGRGSAPSAGPGRASEGGFGQRFGGASSSGGGFQGFGGRAAGGMQGLEGESEARERGFQRFSGFRGGGFRR